MISSKEMNKKRNIYFYDAMSEPELIASSIASLISGIKSKETVIFDNYKGAITYSDFEEDIAFCDDLYDVANVFYDYNFFIFYDDMVNYNLSCLPDEDKYLYLDKKLFTGEVE